MWSYPLQWPSDWPRTATPKVSAFNTGLYDAKMGLADELRKLGAHDPIVTTNLPIGRAGAPLANSRNPVDAGVAVYFTLDGAEMCFPCDKWFHISCNLHAIELTIAALRGIERWGAKEMMTAAFKGYAALPPATSAVAEAWWTTLEVSPEATRDEINRAYRRLARKLHPDTALGDVERFKIVNIAYEQALQAIAS